MSILQIQYSYNDQVIMSIMQIQYRANDSNSMSILQTQYSTNDQVIITILQIQHKTQWILFEKFILTKIQFSSVWESKFQTLMDKSSPPDTSEFSYVAIECTYKNK